MMETLKEEAVLKEVDQWELVEKVGGVFRLCALIQKRMRELVMGARPLVEVPSDQRQDRCDFRRGFGDAPSRRGGRDGGGIGRRG